MIDWRRRRATLAVLLLVAISLLAIDAWSKAAVHNELGPSRRLSIVPGRIWLEPSATLNRGALLGMGRRFGSWSNRLFTVLGILAAIAILSYAATSQRPLDGPTALALGLILGGALGNVHDRLGHGGVRDFIHLDLFGLSWPIFNLADVGLVVGAGLFLWSAWREPPDDAQSP